MTSTDGSATMGTDVTSPSLMCSPDKTSIKQDDTVFRVRNIPIDLPRERLKAALRKRFCKLPNCSSSKDATITRIKTRVAPLAPSCFDQKTQVAFVRFSPELPQDLKELRPNGDLTFPLEGWGPLSGRKEGFAEKEFPSDSDDDDECYELVIDRHFGGLTQMYKTTGEVKADLIAVCGLDGHPYGSFAGKELDNQMKKMWLHDFLSKDFPNFRTMVFGYDSKLRDSHGLHAIADYTDQLLEELSRVRVNPEAARRPIVFVGHSFGGIIIAQSVVKAKHRGNPICQNIKAFMFFATPHRGLKVQDILAALGEKSSRAPLVASIEENAKPLSVGLERFIDCLPKISPQVISFSELEETPQVVKV